MSIRVQHRHSNVPGARPTALLPYELAVNTADRKLYLGGPAGQPIALLPDTPALKDFLPLGQTMADLASGAINASPVINAALAHPVGIVHIPPGRYRLDQPLTPITQGGGGIFGLGPSSTELIINFPAGDVIQIGNGVIVPGIVTIEGIKLTTAMARTSGAAIHVRAAHGTSLRRFVIGPGLNPAGGLFNQYDALTIEGGTDAFITTVQDFEISHATGEGIGLHNYPVDTTITNGVIASCRTGLDVTHASGVYGHNIDIISSTDQGIRFHPAANENVNAVFMTGVLSDSSVNDNWLFDGSGFIVDVHLTGCWGSGSTNGSGVNFAGPFTDGVAIINSHFHFNGKHGINIAAGKNITVGAGCHTLMNSQLAVNGHNGVAIQAGVSDVTVSGITSGYGGFFANQGGTNKQAFGLTVEAGTGSRIVITDNRFPGNGFAGCNVVSTGSDIRVANNIGFITALDGAAQIAVGQTSVQVQTFINAPASRIRVLLTPTVDLADAGVQRLWVDQTAGTNVVTVRCNAPVTNTLFFNWRASAYGA